MGGATQPGIRIVHAKQNFNPRSPWGERPVTIAPVPLSKRISIHAPRGGSDKYAFACGDGGLDFNPRSPWGERQLDPTNTELLRQISIHAPRGGSDGQNDVACLVVDDFNPRSPWGERPICDDDSGKSSIFQSTLPVGGATVYTPKAGRPMKISIHAPRGGSDVREMATAEARGDFNPRSPWGERLLKKTDLCPVNRISIHAPRGGSDILPTMRGGKI